MRPLIVFLLFVQYCGVVPVNAAEDGIVWEEAVQMAKRGDADFAFMYFRILAHDYPDSRRAVDAQFALGEYYFLQGNFAVAAQEFGDFCARYPKRKETLAALGYLYQMARMQGQTDAMKKYRDRVVASHQVILIFDEKQSFQFLSGFQRRHKVAFYIDKIEVWIDDKLFSEIPF